MRRLGVGLVLVLALFVAGCHANTTPRHDATVGVNVLSHALGGLQDEVKILCDSGVVKPTDCRKIGTAMTKVWQLDEAARASIVAWVPGKPMPQNVAAEITAVRQMMVDLGPSFTTPDLTAKALTVFDAVASTLMIFLPTGA